MGDSDAELAGRTASGDTIAFEALYRRHVGRVWRYAWFRTGRREAAAEIVQETFLRVPRSAGQFEGRSTFTTWLHAVARSVAVEWLRRERREAEVKDPSGAPGVYRPLRVVPGEDEAGAETAGVDQRTAVREAVASLPAAQRDVIVLFELVGLGVRETADVLGWGESRVKVTLFRARRRLAEALRDLDGAARAHRSG